MSLASQLDALTPDLATIRAQPAKFYTAAELAAIWNTKPASVRWWVLFMRRASRGPWPDQVERKRRHGYNLVRYRADYCLLLERTFICGIGTPRRP